MKIISVAAQQLKKEAIHTSKRGTSHINSKTNAKAPHQLDEEQQIKLKAYKRIVGSAIFLILPSLELYRRYYLDGERKIQQGEFNPVDGTIREFTEEEKKQKFQNSWLTKLFGAK
ncbi:hypothetical protein CANARDRAFT_82916 [[Candida] arabinofermentans NRRL YB-2248]|uniref:Uncharacterized protein n=1 Tax=[Candida] arabinofermentans NRRL YB-2248 TaxID=983967 RepID=A0A1E4SV29_9ASCO|nr:hypothetical protein CANARDRAFT_82916 [[Candida] arabinofermentans NRRL YB-2248]